MFTQTLTLLVENVSVEILPAAEEYAVQFIGILFFYTVDRIKDTKKS